MRACLALTWIAAASMACAGPEASTCPGVADDYAVWNALLAERGDAVVVNETLTLQRMEFGQLAEQGMVSGEALGDLIRSNHGSMVIDEARLERAGELQLLPRGDVPGTHEDEAWDDFSQRYETPAALHLSRPGFQCGEAIVHVFRECGDLCSSGTFYVLAVNEEGEWVVFRQYQSWIS
jgi:hypothetical protein